MELIMFITVLCSTSFVLQTPCTSLEIKIQSSNEQAKGVELSHPTVLPRKLRFTEEAVALKVNANEAHHSNSNTKQEEHVSGKAKEKEEGSRGTRQEWVESGADNISEYFTMDYSHVRRRRPIHNKSRPVAP